MFTGSARELVLRNHTLLSLRLAGNDFRPYGGKYKAIYKNDPKHYMRIMNRNKGGHVDLLTNYTAEQALTSTQLTNLQGKAIQGQNGKAIYVIDHGKRRCIPNADTFFKLNYTMLDVIVLSDQKVKNIPEGDSMPSLALSPTQLANWQGKAIRGHNGKSIYVFDQGKRRSIPNFDTFFKLNYTMLDVIVLSDQEVKDIPEGESMPSLK